MRRNNPAATTFVPGQGTIATTTFDLLDRPTTNVVFGDNGSNARRVLGMSRTIYNSVGAPLFTHTLAQSSLPSSIPALPNGAIVDNDVWATEALTYDAALRVETHRPEGRTLPTTATYDGFGMLDVVGPTRSAHVDVTPRLRQRLTTHTVVGEGPDTSDRLYTEFAEWDGAGNTIATTMTDLGNGVDRTSTATFDSLGRIRSATDPTGRTVAVTFDLGGRITSRIEKVGANEVRASEFEHDAMGRVTVETPEEAPETVHTYDRAGRRRVTTSGMNAKAFTTEWRFDDAGRLIERETLRGAAGSNPARITEWDYPENRASPQNIVLDNTVAKSWTRDGLDRPVVATDFNVSDGTPTFNASRPTLVTTLSYDTMGRTLVDETHGTFPSSSPTLGGVTNALLSRASWTRSATFRGPSSITTVKGEKIEWTYSTTTATLNEIERTGVANTRTITASLQSEGGQWTRATIGGITIAKERDAFGFVTSSSVTTSSDETVFEETLLRGPTGRITADRRKGVLFSDRARSYKYDALQRLTELKIDTNTAMSREAFVAQVNAALSDEDAGYNVLTSVDATVTLSSTQADVLTNATVDHEGRGYTALDDPDAAGVPLEQVNTQLIDRDERDRVKDDGALVYTWDVFDRLVLVTRDGTEELRIAYDGVGRRRLERRLVTMPTSGTTTEDAVLEYAGANVIEEYAAEGPATFLTVTHAPGIDAPLIAAAGPTAAATTHTWALGTNARGDASSALNLDTETVNEEAILDAWGEREIVGASNTVCVEGGEASGTSLPDGGCADESRALQRFGLAGARLHARTKLVDMRNRVYATHTRSFLTKDPLGNIDSEGLWNYVAGDPINFRDPWGLTPAPERATPSEAPIEPGSTSAEAPLVFEPEHVVVEVPSGDGGDIGADETAHGVDEPDNVAAGAAAAAVEKLLDNAVQGVTFPYGAAIGGATGAIEIAKDPRAVNPFREFSRAAESAASTCVEAGARCGEDLFNATYEAINLVLGALFGGRSGPPKPRTPAPACFVEGTLVSTPEGFVPIEELEVGDLVACRDEFSPDDDAFCKVDHVFVTPNVAVFDLEIRDENGETSILGVSVEHPFYVRDAGWVRASDLARGDLLVGASSSLTVGSSTWRAVPQTVFNIEVDAAHTYFVGEARVWVHNKATKNKYKPKLSDPHGLPKEIVSAYDDINIGKGTPRVDASGKQKTFAAKELRDRTPGKNKYEGWLEWDVPGTKHRILENPKADPTTGKRQKAYVLEHDYSRPRLFPNPWFPDGG